MKIFLALLLSAAVWAQALSVIVAGSNAPAVNTISVLTHIAGQSTNQNSVTTGTMDTTGASTIACVASWYANVGNPTISDSKTNSWTGLVQHPPDPTGNNYATRIYYVDAPTAGSGHTFTLSLNGTFPALSCIALAGTASPSPDTGVENGNQATPVGSLATGTVTPSQARDILITGTTVQNTATPSVTAPFTVTDALGQVGGQSVGTGLAYEIQTGTTARNPTWTQGGSVNMAVGIAGFKVHP